MVPSNEDGFMEATFRVLHLPTGRAGPVMGDDFTGLTREGNVVTDRGQLMNSRSARVIHKYGHNLVHDAATGLFASDGKERRNAGREIVFEGRAVAKLPHGKEQYNYGRVLLRLADNIGFVLYAFRAATLN